jgi:predicted N-acetyltransferase YhbS
LGDDKYFGRFGYKPASDFLIELPFPAPKKNCMAIEL